MTLFLLLLLFFAPTVYESFKGPLEAEIAVQQLTDSIVNYSISREIASREFILKTFFLLANSVLLVIWGTYFLKKIRKDT